MGRSGPGIESYRASQFLERLIGFISLEIGCATEESSLKKSFLRGMQI
jgi:hypothetical protein